MSKALDDYKAKRIKALKKKSFVSLTDDEIDEINAQVNKACVDEVVKLINYKANKVKVLTNEFLIKLTNQDIERIKAQKSEMWVDSIAHNIIMERL